MNIPPTVSHPIGDGPASPLSDEHYRALHEAKAGRKKIDVAIGVATFNGWSLGLFAGLSGLILLFSFSFVSLFICVGLGAVAHHEFKGRAMLRQLDVGGARLLGYNQIALGVVIVGYCLWSLIAVFVGPSPYAEVIAQNPELEQVLGSTGEIYVMGAAIVYGLVIVLTVPYQALMSWYYFSRAKHVARYIDQTPAWVTQMQKAAA
jgi:hypothetical protein